jgi:all-trans-retinol 13,14-reductase
MPDVAVIGAGVSGMTAAAVLAGCGASVTLVEKASAAGPLIGGFTRGGLACDSGFHLAGGLAEGEMLRRYLRFVGIDRYLKVFDAPPGGSILVRCLSPSLDITIPEGEAEVRRRFTETFPAEASAIDGFMGTLDTHYRKLPFVGLAEQDGVHAPLAGGGGPSLQEALDGAIADPLLAGVLSSPTILYGVSPREAPLALHAGVANSYYRSARGIAGGGAAIVAAFLRVLGDAGVELRLGRGVESVVAGAGGVEGVRLEGGEVIPCSAAIATVHPKLALAMAPEGAFRTAMAWHLTQLEESMTACVLNAVCERWRDAFGRRNLVIMPTPDSFSSPMSGPVASRPLYLAPFPTEAADESPRGFTVIVPVDPAETAPWFASVPGHRPAAYAAFKESIAAATGVRLNEAVPELDGKFRFVDVATPLTYRDFANSPAGSLYGVKHAVGQINPLPITRTRGFLLAGQAIGAPGIMGAMISAFMAASLILGADEVRKGLEGTS